MEHESGIDLGEARRIAEFLHQRLQEIATSSQPPAAGLRSAADALETLARELRERANSVGLPYPPDEA
jgi:hypothetical protein